MDAANLELEDVNTRLEAGAAAAAAEKATLLQQLESMQRDQDALRSQVRITYTCAFNTYC